MDISNIIFVGDIKYMKNIKLKLKESYKKKPFNTLIKSIYEFQEKRRSKIYKKGYGCCFVDKLFKYSMLRFILLIALLIIKTAKKIECNDSFIFYPLLFLSFVYISSFLVSNINELYKSVFSFVILSAGTFFIGGFCISSLIYFLTKKFYLSYFFTFFLMVILWSYLSTLDDLEIARIGNSIISAIVALILGIPDNLKGTLLFTKPETEYSKIYSLVKAMISDENALKIVFFPFVAVTLIGLISCEYKEFWIKRYGKSSEEIYTQYE